MTEREDPLRLVGAVSLILLFLFLLQGAVEGFGRRPPDSPNDPARTREEPLPPADPPPEPRSPSAGEIVFFNRQSLKFHCLSCEWARKCTRNCTGLSKEEAGRRGGVPCRICRGSCL